jgi:hypothetical protein
MKSADSLIYSSAHTHGNISQLGMSWSIWPGGMHTSWQQKHQQQVYHQLIDLALLPHYHDEFRIRFNFSEGWILCLYCSSSYTPAVGTYVYFLKKKTNSSSRYY